MIALGIKEQDIEESFIRSSAPGGQNVNKVSTCVYLKHRPTGIVIKAQKFRSQGMNRRWARESLFNRIEQKQKEKIQSQIQAAAKLRRQKRKRPHSLQEKILEGKRIRSEKKKIRRPIRMSNLNDY